MRIDSDKGNFEEIRLIMLTTYVHDRRILLFTWSNFLADLFAFNPGLKNRYIIWRD